MNHDERASSGVSASLVIILAAGAILRLPFLFAYPLDEEEFYTLRYSEVLLETPAPAVITYPVIFGATRALTELFGPSVFSLRLLAVVCGVLAPLMLYLLGRRLVGDTAATCAALLAVAWPWHQFFSGQGRYYAPVFLAGTLVLHRLYLVLVRGRTGDFAALVVLLLLAALIHPTGLLALGGGAMALASPRVRGMGRRGQYLLLAGGVAALAAIFTIPPFAAPILRVLSGAGGKGYEAVHFVQSVAFNVSPVILFLALLGVVGMFARRRYETIYLIVFATVPLAALTALVMLQEGLQARYAMVVLPAVMLLAGAGLERLLRPVGERAVRFAIGAACVAPLLPGLVSNLADGDRHDVAAVSGYLEARLEKGQLLFAEAHSWLAQHLYGLRRWLPAGVGTPPFPDYLGESPPSSDLLDIIFRRRADAWFVVPDNLYRRLAASDRRDFRVWLAEHCVVEQRFGRRRLDYHHNVLILFRTRPGEKT